MENTHEILIYRLRNGVLQNKFRSYSIFVSITYIMHIYDQTILGDYNLNTLNEMQENAILNQ